MSWVKIEPPRKKADWPGKNVRLLEIPPSSKYDFLEMEPIPQLPIKPGDVVQIYMRRAIAQWPNYLPQKYWPAFGARVLDVIWKCPHCDMPHHLLVPESWVAEGKVEFVEVI